MKFVREYLPYVIIIVFVLLIRTIIITPVRVTGTSMDPTLKEGDILLLYKLGQINRFDVVVIDKSVEGDELIKRIIALPGESVEMVDGKLYINDTLSEDPYASGLNIDFNKVYLGEDEYFVMGDNRTVSLDSRVFGKIKRDSIKGTTKTRIYPFNKIGSIPCE